MPDNLCMDTFIRSYMDVEGYVPIALLCSYPNVGGYNAPIANIIARLLETAATSRLEVDAPNETVRLKENWEMVRNKKYFNIAFFFAEPFFPADLISVQK